MQYSPKLKLAMTEIKAILKKHDIAGSFVIHTPGHSEYLNSFETSYSCVKVDGDNIRIRAKAEDYGGSKKIRDQKLKDTSNMFHLLAEVGGFNVVGIMDISKQLDKLLDSEHFGGGHTTETTQNN